MTKKRGGERQSGLFHLRILGQKLILSPARSYLWRYVLVFWDTDTTMEDAMMS